MSDVIEGTVAFSNLKAHEVYDGKSTGKYSLTLTLDQDTAKKLSDQGVKLRDFEGTPQRKFTTNREIDIYNPDMSSWAGDEIPRKSKVKIQVRVGDAYKDFGNSAYVNAIQVIEKGDGAVPDEFQPVQGSAPVETPAFEAVEDDDLPF